QTLPPGLDADRDVIPDRAAIRAHLEIDDDLPLVAMLSDPPAAADARLAVLAAGLAGESRSAGVNHAGRTDAARTCIDPRVLMCPVQYRRPQARRMLRDLGGEHMIIQSPDAAYPWRILPACDAAIAVGPHAGGLA